MTLIVCWLGLCVIAAIIAMFLKFIGLNEKKSEEIASLIVGIPILVIIVVIFLGSIFAFPAMFIKEFWLNDSRPQTTSDYASSQKNEYHHTSGYTRSDGTEVNGYVSGNPDGIRENNIEYMRDNGDYEGVREAYSSAK
ncbi:hypothetical protein [Acinetobacter bohemicus]|uniref:hypothetical protein n=1 Tax=Acinetobacter bohemicus TaxID=1435036 RepID=UPI004042D7FD